MRQPSQPYYRMHVHSSPDGSSKGVMELPPATTLPRVRYRLKTQIKRIRCITKSFAPREFSGFIGAGRRVAHSTHSLAGGRGVVWCWKCGKIATTKPRGLVKKCTEAPSPYGKATLKRLRNGLPPFTVKKWLEEGSSFFRQLTICDTADNTWNLPRTAPATH